MEAKQRKMMQYHGSSTKTLMSSSTLIPEMGAVRPANNNSPVRNSNTYATSFDFGGAASALPASKRGGVNKNNLYSSTTK